MITMSDGENGNFKPFADASKNLLERSRGPLNEKEWEEIVEAAASFTKNLFKEDLIETEERRELELEKFLKDWVDELSPIKKETEFRLINYRLDEISSKLTDIEKRVENLEESNQMETVIVQEIEEKEAKKLIMSCLEEKGSAYPSDIAKELNLSVGLVLDLMDELAEEGKIGEVDGN